MLGKVKTVLHFFFCLFCIAAVIFVALVLSSGGDK